MSRESQAMQAVREARSALLSTHPFFGVLSLKLGLEETRSIPTFSVDGKRLAFNPEYVESVSRAELKTIIASRCMCLALLHHARQGAREHATWARASSTVINGHLLKDGFVMPAGALVDARFDGKTAEQVYTALKDEQAPPTPPEDQGDESESGDEPDQGGGDDRPDSDQGQAGGDDGQGDKPGSGPGGDTPDPCGDFESAGPEDSAEAGDQAREWQENANQAMRAASSAGKLPGGIKAAVGAALTGKADWKTLLRRWANDQVRTRSTFAKPNKRFPGVYLPGKVRDGMGLLAVMVDTSGSIFANPAAVDRFAAEVSSIVAEVEPAGVVVIYCDASVQHVETYETGEEIKLVPVGGGGTRFSPAFAYVDAENLQPVGAIYLTDLECYDFGPEPAYPVMWAKYGTFENVPPFGEVVEID